MSNNNFTPGQYVVCRASQHDKPQVRMFHSWNEPRLGHPQGPYARVTTAGVFQFDPNAPTESFLLVEPWAPEPGQWVWHRMLRDGWPNYVATSVNEAICNRIARYGAGYPFIIAPLTLPPFVAPGDKY